MVSYAFEKLVNKLSLPSEINILLGSAYSYITTRACDEVPKLVPSVDREFSIKSPKHQALPHIHTLPSHPS